MECRAPPNEPFLIFDACRCVTVATLNSEINASRNHALTITLRVGELSTEGVWVTCATLSTNRELRNTEATRECYGRSRGRRGFQTVALD